MLEAYSINKEAAANAAIQFDNVTIQKGCTAKLSGGSTIELNKCGVYMVGVDVSAEASTTIQLYKNGVAQPQAQGTGATPAFITLVQVSGNNSCKCCDSPTTLQVMNTTATTLSNANIAVTKIC